MRLSSCRQINFSPKHPPPFPNNHPYCFPSDSFLHAVPVTAFDIQQTIALTCGDSAGPRRPDGIRLGCLPAVLRCDLCSLSSVKQHFSVRVAYRISSE